MKRKIIIDCKKIKEKALQLLNEEMTRYNYPSLCIIQVGDDPASNTYTRNKKNLAEEVGILCHHFVFNEEMDYASLRREIIRLAQDDYDGVILQLPLPSHLKEHEQSLLDLIPPHKDVDCLATVNVGKLHSGNPYLYPCTAQACIDVLDEFGYELRGKDVLIIGRQNLLGVPLGRMMMNKNATVTMAHSHTRGLQGMLESGRYDVVVSAVGIPQLFKHINTDFILDVGINRDLDNKLCGDIDLSTCRFDYATTVGGGIGGLGQLTTLNLLKNTIKSHRYTKGDK